MKISKEVILSCNIPSSAYDVDYSSGKVQFIIRNSIYANVMWMHLWYNVFSKSYNNQDMIVSISDFDLTAPVIFDENFILISAPPSAQSIDYYGTFDDTYIPFFVLNVSSLTILICYIIFVVLVLIINFTIGKNWSINELM